MQPGTLPAAGAPQAVDSAQRRRLLRALQILEEAYQRACGH